MSGEEAAERFRKNDAEGESNYILVTREHSCAAADGAEEEEEEEDDDDDDGGGGTGGTGGTEGATEGGAKEDDAGTRRSRARTRTRTRVRVRAVDPTTRGNVGRWLNHACDGGNLAPWMVRSAGDGDEGADGGCRVVFFTTKVVRAGEELRWKYGESKQPETEEEALEEVQQEEELEEAEEEEERGKLALKRGAAAPSRRGRKRQKRSAETTRRRKRCSCGTDACRGWMPFDDAALLQR